MKAREKRTVVEWASRDCNKEADPLANGITNSSDLARRMDVSAQSWYILPQALEAGREAERAFQKMKETHGPPNRSKKQARRKVETRLKMTDPWYFSLRQKGRPRGRLRVHPLRLQGRRRLRMLISQFRGLHFDFGSNRRVPPPRGSPPRHPLPKCTLLHPLVGWLGYLYEVTLQTGDRRQRIRVCEGSASPFFVFQLLHVFTLSHLLLLLVRSDVFPGRERLQLQAYVVVALCQFVRVPGFFRVRGRLDVLCWSRLCASSRSLLSTRISSDSMVSFVDRMPLHGRRWFLLLQVLRGGSRCCVVSHFSDWGCLGSFQVAFRF